MAKHLSLDDRSAIRSGLHRMDSFKQIGRDLGKDCTTISKEVRNHLVSWKTDAMGKAYNACVHRQGCDRRRLCGDAPGTVSAGPVRTAITYVLILNRRIAPGCLSLPMCAMAILTGTSAYCRNVSMTRSLPTMSIERSSLKQGKALLTIQVYIPCV